NISNNISVNRYFLFSDDIIKEIDIKDFSTSRSDNINDESTNISKTLNTISKILGDKKISTINIISDGIFNKGGNPSYSPQFPDVTFNYFLIGDTIQRNDISIKNIFFNPIVYTESNTQILVEFNSDNYNRDIKINLFEEDNLLQEKKISVNTENKVYNCSFNIKSNKEGMKKYKIKIENEQNEVTDKNNSEEFFIEYINNKFKLLVLSGNPSADFSYFTESIKRINNFEAKFFVQKSPGNFYEGQLPALDEFNLLILINFPTTSTDLNLINKLNDNLKNISLPIFFISGSNTDYERLKILNKYLPFTSTSKSGNDERTSIKLINDLKSEVNNIFSFKKISGNLPEIFIPGNNFALIPETQTLLYSSKLSKPVLVISKNSDRNSAALLAFNFYKWRLNSTNNESKIFFEDLLTGITLSISEKEKNKKIYLNPDKQIYSPFEQIKINGILNPGESPGNVSIKLQIFNSSFTKEIETIRTSNNSFTSEILNLGDGEYSIKGTLIQNGNEIAYDIKKILVKESNLEYKNTKSDNSILNILSKNSGGDLISEQNLNEINKKIELKNEVDLIHQNRIHKVYLNSNLFILFFLIIILSIEWFIRKRMNLP
ncbi:MAG: hypothetical protein NTU73_02040, partial [Ignavibacteriae bacterium]|nr:hypothetical protein [Ignavibacteriota bacterium]